jgi:DNA-binding NarL/FixJ family response regulator
LVVGVRDVFMRVVIVEDSVLLREGIARLMVEYGDEVVASLGNASRLLATVGEVDPDVVIIDVRMPPTFTDEGLRAAVELRTVRPSTPVLVLSQYVEERYASELLGAGAVGVGYLLKERVADVAEFVDAVHRVADGGTVLDAEVVQQLFARSRRREPLEALTPREREVLGLMAQGLSNAGIAQALVVSDGAVEKHISSIFGKLGLPTTDTEHRRVLAVLRYLQTA